MTNPYLLLFFAKDTDIPSLFMERSNRWYPVYLLFLFQFKSFGEK